MELASLRIGACLAILLEDSAGPARVAVRLSPALRKWPEGLGFVEGHLPSEPAAIDALVLCFRAALVLSLVGLWTRWSLLGAALLGALLLPLAQLVGPTVHNHHLFWFLLLLATAGPSAGTRWSLDRVFGRAKVERENARARVVIGCGRLLLGIVYFFPGYWKLATSGISWFEPDALIHLFHSKWYQFDFVPWWRIDHFPKLLAAGGAGVVLLELSFPALVFTRRGRSIALVGGLGFHVFSSQFLGIAFAPLWLCYGLLIDWQAVDAWLRSERLVRREAALGQRLGKALCALSNARTASVVGLLAIGGLLVQGVRGQGQAWPWACYPTFEWRVSGEQRDVLAVVTTPKRRLVYPTPRAARQRTQNEWGQVFRLLGAYAESPQRLEQARCAYAELLVRQGRLPSKWPIDLYEVQRSTEPERWNDAPRVGQHLASCAVP